MSTASRITIRTGIQAALVDKTDATNRVYTSRYTALVAESYPLILIYTPAEDADIAALKPSRYNRKLSLIISGVVEANDEMDTELDTMAAAIEEVMGKGPVAWGGANSAVLKKSETTIETKGEKLFGAIHLEYELTYFG